MPQPIGDPVGTGCPNDIVMKDAWSLASPYLKILLIYHFAAVESTHGVNFQDCLVSIEGQSSDWCQEVPSSIYRITRTMIYMHTRKDLLQKH